jgi:uncharacterized protein YbjT (DUF2867 family)
MDVVVAGSTGLVGRELVRLLGERPGVVVRALVRRPKALAGIPGATEVTFDFGSAADYGWIGRSIPCDVLYCCIGTTIRVAGSVEAFRRVDRDIPIALLHRLEESRPDATFALVSSVGADWGVGHLLAAKNEVEAAVRGSGLPHVIVRPSLLLGTRESSRPGERIAAVLAVPLFGLLEGITGRSIACVGRYRPIHAAQVARALIRHTLDAADPRPHRVVEGWDLFE